MKAKEIHQTEPKIARWSWRRVVLLFKFAKNVSRS